MKRKPVVLEDDELFVALAVDMKEESEPEEKVVSEPKRVKSSVIETSSSPDKDDDEVLVALAIDLRPEPEQEPEEPAVVKTTTPEVEEDIEEEDDPMLDVALLENPRDATDVAPQSRRTR